MNFAEIIIMIIIMFLGIRFPRRRNSLILNKNWSYNEITRENQQSDNINRYSEFLALRNSYKLKLDKWVKTHVAKNNLINNHCELSLYHTEKNEEKPEDLCFHCKEHSFSNKPGRFFCIKGNNQHVATMWSIINMEFNQNSSYKDIKALYLSLNDSNYTEDGTKYFHENAKVVYPNFVVNKWAQNEHCKMEIQNFNGEKILICRNIWGNEYFILKADKLILYVILGEFARNTNKMEVFKTLLEKYKQRNDCTVIFNFESEKEKIIKSKDSKNTTIKTKEYNVEKFNERNIDL